MRGYIPRPAISPTGARPGFESSAATWVATDRRQPTMQGNLDERTCESCGETFVTSEQDTSQYCSLTCRDNDSNPFSI